MTWAAAEQDAGAVADAAAASMPTVRRTLRFKSGKGGHHAQGRCRIKGCTKHSTYVCSACTHSTDAAQKQFWFCNHTTVEGSDCFTKHIAWHREQENKNGGGRGQLDKGGGGYIGGDDTQTTATGYQSHNSITFIKKHIMCQIFCNQCRAAEATRRHTIPWNIVMIFMD